MLRWLKALVRTRSVSFTHDYVGPGRPGANSSVAWWSGDGRPVHYRPATADASIAYDILFKQGRKSEYWLPPELKANLILDIGGNIGITARYLAHLFPEATIHSFEPMPDNCELLRLNTAGSRVVVHPFGLAARSGTLEFRVPGDQSANRGSFSLIRPAAPGDVTVQAEVKEVGPTLGSLGLTAPDIIKIDVEGAESEILRAMPDDILAATTWIYGELHAGEIDPRLAFGVLERLAEWFDIEVHKPMRKRNWFFDACNRKASGRFRGFRRRR